MHRNEDCYGKWEYFNNKSAWNTSSPSRSNVNEAVKYKSDISFKYGEGKTANAKSVISILASGVKCGEEITLTADGSDEEEALKAVSESFKESLKE